MAKYSWVGDFQGRGHAFCGLESKVCIWCMLHLSFADVNSYDFKNKRVGVIGGGSSSIQIVPNLQPHVSKMSCFVRSRTWISNPFGDGRLLPSKISSQS